MSSQPDPFDPALLAGLSKLVASVNMSGAADMLARAATGSGALRGAADLWTWRETGGDVPDDTSPEERQATYVELEAEVAELRNDLKGYQELRDAHAALLAEVAALRGELSTCRAGRVVAETAEPSATLDAAVRTIESLVELLAAADTPSGAGN